MRFRNIAGAVAVIGLVALVTPVAASAQQTPAPADASPVVVTDTLLQQFASVYPEVMKVTQVAQARIAAADDVEDKKEIRSELTEKIADVVEDADMTMSQYTAIVNRLNHDEALREKFKQMLMEQQGGGSN